MQNILELTILKMKKYFFKSKIIHYFQEIVCRGNFRISKYTVYNQATFFLSSHKMAWDCKKVVTLEKLWFF